MKEEEYEAISDIATLWEDPSSTYPRRSWLIIRAFYDALNTEISVWIHNIRKIHSLYSSFFMVTLVV